MIIVKIWGGLGNQLFQYAAAKNLSIKFNTKIVLDVSWFHEKNLDTKRHFLLEKIGLNEDCINGFFANCLRGVAKIIHKTKMVDAYLIDDKDWRLVRNSINLMYLDGYWQDYQLFHKENELILKNIIYPGFDVGSVAIHVRRGDYVDNEKNRSIYKSCDKNYYINSIDKVKNIVKKPFYRIYSDDIDWAKKNIVIDGDVIYSNGASVDDGGLSDFIGMMSCENYIIANSTFSWWAAYIGWCRHKKPGIVCCPSYWRTSDINPKKELILDGWISICN